MKCMSCKKEIPQGSRFCNCCGAEQKTATEKIKFNFKIRKFTAKGKAGYIRDNQLLSEVNEWLKKQSLLIAHISYEPEETVCNGFILKSITIIYVPLSDNDEIYQIGYFLSRNHKTGLTDESFNMRLDEFSPWLSYFILEGDCLYKTFVTYIVNKTPNLTQEL